MYFPQFLVGIFTTTTVVGTWIYAASGSLWKAVLWSAVTLILIQLGYFALVVRQIYRLEHEDAFKTAPNKQQKNLPNYPNGKRAR
ncbi:hypothetical protein [Mesorhizobium sp. 131-2-1]|uniref:hypothetical protein n=1 Tax=Mesorhizobium sp. 131-2-1 TaxID=2744518 RepID=UPI0019267306|nr:hypothetical protein [Mesorhizobium sp. 131-2-1]